MTATKKEDDLTWFNNGNCISTEGYPVNAIEEGPESSNCGKAMQA